MGVKNLWDILESCKKILPLHHLQNKRVCIDLSCWMVQLQNVNKTHCSMQNKVYLQGLFHRLRALIALNCSLIFVTDGSIPAIKLSTYRRRLNSGCEITQDDANSKKACSQRRNTGSAFSCMIKEAKTLGLALGIPCLDGIEEGEAQCALLNSEMLCDGCFTSDSDAFLFGARTVYREICLGEGGFIICYEMEDIESTLGYGRDSLITLALLLGSDYFPGVRGIGQDSACQIVKSIGDNNVLKYVASEGISFAKKPKGLKKLDGAAKGNSKENVSESEINSKGSAKDNPFLQVIDAYLKPKCHGPDSDAVRRALATHPFQRNKLQLICTQFFDWPPEKTDEYILPKIAEKDLRRYADLRKTSSDVGLELLMHGMPVKCPISEVIKHRRAQGKECFEVSWLDLDGLESSIVPADLVERNIFALYKALADTDTIAQIYIGACPEKIRTFKEAKAKAKGKKNHKRKPRQKKPESETSLTELELKLQDLLLDIEFGSTSTCTSSLSPRSSSSKYMAQDTVIDLVEESPCCSKNSKNSTHGSSTDDDDNLFSTKNEVIDLLSPSPMIPTRRSTIPREGINLRNVIDLSDSETDTETEHAAKARALRLFISTITD